MTDLSGKPALEALFEGMTHRCLHAMWSLYATEGNPYGGYQTYYRNSFLFYANQD